MEQVTISLAEYDRLKAVVRDVELRRQQFRRRDVYPAKWDGRCSQCGEPFYRGDPMVKETVKNRTKWVHPASCESASVLRVAE